MQEDHQTEGRMNRPCTRNPTEFRTLPGLTHLLPVNLTLESSKMHARADKAMSKSFSSGNFEPQNQTSGAPRHHHHHHHHHQQQQQQQHQNTLPVTLSHLTSLQTILRLGWPLAIRQRIAWDASGNNESLAHHGGWG